MPIMKCDMNGKPGFKWGEQGKCYLYNPGDEKSMSMAKEEAVKQGIAIGDIKMSELMEAFNETIEINKIEILNQYPNTHGIKFTDQDFSNYVKNFEEYKDVFLPHVKLTHPDQQKVFKELFGLEVPEGEEFPLGKVKRIYQEGKSIFADLIDVPKKIGEFVFKKFRSISPEILQDFRETGKDVIRSIVLLNNPSQKHILDVHLGERASRFDGEIIFLKEDQMDPNKVENGQVVDEDSLASKIVSGLKGLFKPKADEIAAPVELSELQTSIVKLQEENKKLSEMIVEQNKKRESHLESVLKMQENIKQKEIDTICKSALNDGVPPAVINKLKALMLSEFGERNIKLSEKVDGQEITVEKSVISFCEDFFQTYPQKISFSQQSKTKLEEKSTELLKKSNARKVELMESGLSEYEALKQVGREMPELLQVEED